MKTRTFFSGGIHYLMLVILFFSVNLSALSVCPDSLSNYWTFDADDISATYDAVGNCDGIGGILSSGAPAGVVGVSRHFDGSTSYNFSDYPDYAWHKDLSVAVWCRFTATAADSMVMLGSWEDEKTSWWMGIEEATGYPIFCLYDSLGEGTEAIGSQAINNDGWHFLVATYNASTHSLKLYIDGSQEANENITFSGSFKTSGELTMGALDILGTPDHFYTGYLDEVALFREALSLSEINDLMDKSAAGIGYCDELVVPVITSVPVTSILQGEEYSYTVTATGNPAPEFSLQEAPSGMTIDEVTGVITWTASSAGDFTVIVAATNAAGEDTQEFTLSVDALIAPVITSTPVTSVLQYEEYSYTVVATGNPAPEFSLLEAPAGMTIDPVSGEISWTPADFGDFAVIVQASNAGGDDTQEFTITVDELVVPVITSSPELRIMVNVLYTYTVVAEGYPKPELSLEESPAGMSLNPSTGILTWTPTYTGSFDVTITATNSGGTATQDFTLEVLGPCMDNLVSYFQFNEGTGTVTGDDANPRTIDITGNATWTSGRVGSALSFDGSTDYLSFPDHNDFDWSASQDFTIELWCRIDQDKADIQVFIGRDTPASTHWWVGLDNSKKVAFFLYDQTRTGGGMTSLNTINDGEWHHVAAVHRGVQKMNYLYVDGQLNADTSFAYTAGFASPADIQIANFYTSGQHSYLLRGSLDEIAVSKRAISASELSEHYLKGMNSRGYCEGFTLAPAIVSDPVTEVMVNTAYSYTVVAEGVPTPVYSLQTAPAGMSINATSGKITWTPTYGGNFNVTVRATNAAGSATQSFTIRVVEICMNELISYLRFSEGSGPVTVDDAALRTLDVAGKASWTIGRVGSALAFNGTTQYLSMPDHADFDWPASGNFTVELWCKVAGSNNDIQVMIGRETYGSTHWWLGINQTKHATFYLYDESNTGGGMVGMNPINDGQWHHLAAVHNGSTGHNRLYVDGELNVDTSFAYSVGFNSAADIQIANFYRNGQHLFFYQGALDEIAVSNRIIPEAEIIEHFIKGTNGVNYCADFTIAPSITSTPDTLAYLGNHYSYIVESTGLPVPVYSLTQAPAGMTIDPVTGEVSWIPGIAGYFNVTVQASNSVGTASQTYTIHVLETCMEDLITFLKFSEGSGPVTVDNASPRILQMEGNAGWTTGKVGSGASFDGISNGLIIEDHPDFDWSADQDFTIEFWCRTIGDESELQAIIGRETSGSTHWWVGISSGKKAAFYLYDQIGTGGGIYGLDSIDDGSWHHLVALYLGTQGRIKLYVDGKLNAETSYAYSGGFNSASDIHIGNFFTAGQNRYFFRGELDELAVSNRAVTEDEINEHYLKGLNSVDYCEDFSLVPVISSVPDTLAMINQEYLYTVMAEGLPRPEYDLLESPEGMTIDPHSGEISWTPYISGSFTVIVRASNSAGSTFQNYTLVVIEPCMQELISYMDFSEGSGPVSIDKGNLQIIPVEGNASWATGRVGSGLSFDGIEQGISMDAHPDLNWAQDQDFTLELWFRTSATNSALQVFIGRDVPESTHWWLGLNDAHQAAFYLYDESRTGGGLLGLDPLNNGDWHHMAAVHEGASGRILLYVDGELNAETTYSYGEDFSATVGIQIGKFYYNYAYRYFFDGQLDEIAVSNRAIPEQEIFEHYLKGIHEAGYCDDLVLIPEITSEPDLQTYLNTEWTYDVDAIGLPAPVYRLNDPPDGMTIDTITGLIKWTPASFGDFEIEVLAVNEGGQDSQTFTLNVFETCIPEGICYLNFEESGGSVVEDQLSDREGLLVNDPVRQEGLIGNAILFNGVDQYITLPDHPDFDFPVGSGFSFEFWCKPSTENNSLQVCIGRDETESIHWWMGFEADSKLPAFYLYDESRAGAGLTGSIGISDGKWHHLAGVHDAANDKVLLYIDGVLNAQMDFSYASGFSSTSAIQLASMYRNGSYQFFYEGELDEVVIYNRAITANEIQLHHEVGSLGLGYCFSDALDEELNRYANTYDYSIYPIPAQDKFFIDLKSSMTGRVEVQLINALGVILQENTEDAAGLITVNVSGYANGIYIMRIISEDKLVIQQNIIIQ